MTKFEDSESLEILINQAKNGDKQAFSDLYSTLYTPLFRFIKSRTGNHDKSLDICQEVFLKWYKSLDTYEIKMKPLSYLMMIGIRLIINESKKSGSVFLPEEAEEFVADENIVPADINFDLNLSFDKIKILFQDLTENQKNVVTMRYIADADTETIAEALEISLANVRKIESRAIQKIRELYILKYNNLESGR